MLIQEKNIRWPAFDAWFFPALLGTLAIPQFSYPHGLQPLLMVTLQNLGIAFCIQHCIRKRYYLLNCAPAVWLGVLSYSIYLCQEPFFQRDPVHVNGRFPINLVSILLSAMVCHYFVEKPFLRLREERTIMAKALREQAAV